MTLIGRSGSGKTTLLRMINALEIPTEGNVSVMVKVTPQIIKVSNKRTQAIGYGISKL